MIFYCIHKADLVVLFQDNKRTLQNTTYKKRVSNKFLNVCLWNVDIVIKELSLITFRYEYNYPGVTFSERVLYFKRLYPDIFAEKMQWFAFKLLGKRWNKMYCVSVIVDADYGYIRLILLFSALMGIFEIFCNRKIELKKKETCWV